MRKRDIELIKYICITLAVILVVYFIIKLIDAITHPVIVWFLIGIISALVAECIAWFIYRLKWKTWRFWRRMPPNDKNPE